MLFAASLLMLTACAKKKKQDAKSLATNAQSSDGKKKNMERTQRLSIHGEPDIKLDKQPPTDDKPMQATQPTRERTKGGPKSYHTVDFKYSMKSDATQTNVTRTQSSMDPRTDSTRASSARGHPEARAKTTSADPTQESKHSKEGLTQQSRDSDVQATQTFSEKLGHRANECGTA